MYLTRKFAFNLQSIVYDNRIQVIGVVTLKAFFFFKFAITSFNSPNLIKGNKSKLMNAEKKT